jgi:undecaprenyl-diphosphatase
MGISAGGKKLMIGHIGNKQAVKKQNWIFIPIVVLSIVGLFFFDTRIWLAASNLVSREPYYGMTDFITDYGLFLFYAAFAFIFTYALVKKNSELIRLVVAYIQTQLFFSIVLVRILKIIVGRARPGHDPEFTFFSFAFRHNSFPSGHSADAFVSGVFLFYLLKNSKYSAGRYLPLIYALLIAVSRVFISSHYPSDVAAGMAIGILGAWIFIARLAMTSSGKPKPHPRL